MTMNENSRVSALPAGSLQAGSLPGDITLIAAMDIKRAIGANNTIPWSLPEDMRRFRMVTTGHVVIMGRRTWESLGCRPLPNRTNIVISSRPALEGTMADGALPEGVIHARSLPEALAIGREVRPGARVFVIGGGVLYEEALAYATHLDLTEIMTVIPGADTWFPEFRHNGQWREDIGDIQLSKTGLAYRYVSAFRPS